MAVLLLVDQRDEHRGILPIEERDLQDAEWILRQPLAFEACHAVRIGDQELREVAANDRAFLMPHRARAQDAIGGANPAVGLDQGGHDSCAAEPVAGGASDQIFHRLREIQALWGVEPPDQQIVVLASARDVRRKVGAVDQQPIDRRAAVPPGGSSGIPQPLHPGRIERQSGRGREATEHRFIAIVGAYQSPGTIGHGNGIGAALGERARDAPVWFERGGSGGREQPPERDQPTRHDERSREECGGDRQAADQSENDECGRDAAADRDQRGAAKGGGLRGRGERGHCVMLWGNRGERQGLSGGPTGVCRRMCCPVFLPPRRREGERIASAKPRRRTPPERRRPGRRRSAI